MTTAPVEHKKDVSYKGKMFRVCFTEDRCNTNCGFNQITGISIYGLVANSAGILTHDYAHRWTEESMQEALDDAVFIEALFGKAEDRRTYTSLNILMGIPSMFVLSGKLQNFLPLSARYALNTVDVMSCLKRSAKGACITSFAVANSYHMGIDDGFIGALLYVPQDRLMHIASPETYIRVPELPSFPLGRWTNSGLISWWKKACNLFGYKEVDISGRFPAVVDKPAETSSKPDAAGRTEGWVVMPKVQRGIDIWDNAGVQPVVEAPAQ